jgi:hypothetical protein
MLRVVLGSICLLGGFVSTALMLYYFFFTLGSVKPEKNGICVSSAQSRS